MSELSIILNQSNGEFELATDFACEFERLALLGASGSGKTTLLDCLAGFSVPDTGSILFNNRWIFKNGTINREPENRRISYLMQDSRLFPHLTVRENICFSRTTQINEHYGKTILDFLEINSLLDRYPNELSGGEKKRVALAQALFARPELLLLDEPTAGLNPSLQKRIIPSLRNLLDEIDISAVIVSHKPEVVMALADTVVPIEDGCAEKVFPTRKFFQSNHLLNQKAFDPTNYLKGQIIRNDFDDALSTVKVDDDLRFFVNVPRIMDATEPVILEIAASSIALARNLAGDVSHRNHLEGFIAKVREINDSVVLKVKIGECSSVFVEITERTRRDMNLHVKQKVTLLIKSKGIQVHSA